MGRSRDGHQSEGRTARQDAGGVSPGRRAGAHRRPARQGQDDGARAHRRPAGQGVLPGAGRLRHPPHPRLRHGQEEVPLRQRRDRLGHDRGPHGVCVQPGLHGLRRVLGRGACREDLQGHGPGREERRAGHRPERLGRRPHPGRRGLPGRLRRHLPAQHPGLGRGAADQRHHGPLRRRRGLQPGPHRLHLHGEEDQPHVHHRSRRREDRDPRGRLHGRAGRRHRPRHQERRGATSPARTSRTASRPSGS